MGDVSELAALQRENVRIVDEIAQHLPGRVADAAHLLDAAFRWVYLDPAVPDPDQTPTGIDGLAAMFGAVAAATNDTWRVETVNLEPVGREVVVAHVRPSMELGGEHVDTEAVVVWRIVDGRATAAWDVPARRELFA